MAGNRRQINVQVPAKIVETFDRFHRATGGDKQDHVAAALLAYMGLATSDREGVFAAYKEWVGETPPDLSDFRAMLPGRKEGSTNSGVERAKPPKASGDSRRKAV